MLAAFEHLDASRTNGFGQALAAKVGRVLQALPTALGILLEGLLETRRGGDAHRLSKPRGLSSPSQFRGAITSWVKLGAFFQHRLRGFHACFLKAEGSAAISSNAARCCMLKSMSLTGRGVSS
jgi:hypothetical protein